MAINETDLVNDASESERALFRNLGGACHYGWYPVMLSETLESGHVRSVELGDGRIALYRGADGVAHALAAFCWHMGADLALGDVVDNDIRCPFHHFQFGPDGACSKIPTGDRIPRTACQHVFPVAERYGLILVWWGIGDPLYDPPSFPDWDPETMVSMAFEVALSEKLNIEPWLFMTNAVDFAHFRTVHEVPDLNPDVERDGFRHSWTATLAHPAVGEMVTTINIWGTNGVISQDVRGDDHLAHIAMLSPLGESGTRFFMVVVSPKGPDQQQNLDQQKALHSELVNEDLAILNSLRVRDAHLVGSDKAMAAYLRFVRDYPRATFAEIEASSRAR